MRFLYPLAFIGLISIPVIIVMYLFKQKYKEVKVSSLFLWQKAIQNTEAHRPWQKLRSNMLMIIQLIIAAFIVMALASPFLLGQSDKTSKLIILDASMSMQATDVSPSRFEYAKNEIKSIINDMGNEDDVTIIVMQKEPYIAVSSSSDKVMLTSILKNISVTNSDSDLGTTINLVSSIFNEEKHNVYFFGDDNDAFENIPMQNIIVGDSTSNTAITLLSYNKDEDGIIGLVKVKNFLAENATNALSIFCDNEIFDIIDFSIEGFEEKVIFISDLPVDTNVLNVKLTNDDVLMVDNVAYTAINNEQVNKVLFFSEQNVFLENMLNILPNVELYKGNIEDIENVGTYSLYVYDGILPSELPKDGHLLIFNPPVGNSMIETYDDFEINQEINATNSFKFMNEFDFAIKSSKQLVKPEWGYDDIVSGEKVIAVFGQNHHQKIMIFGFDLHNTDLPLKKEFPIFTYNMIQLLLPNNINNIQNAYSGDHVNINVLPNAESAEITTPSGQTINIPIPFTEGAYNDTDEAGVYNIHQELNDGTSVDEYFAVNAFNEVESNLIRNFSDDVPVNRNVTTNLSNKYFGDIIIVFIILLVVVEWFLYNRVGAK